jgi:hypothetical protein
VEKEDFYSLISPIFDKRINAPFGGSTQQQNELLELNPDDAQKLHISDGDCLIIHNSLGELQLMAKVKTVVPKGLFAVRKVPSVLAALDKQRMRYPAIRVKPILEMEARIAILLLIFES